jgi:hypothetical protein
MKDGEGMWKKYDWSQIQDLQHENAICYYFYTKSPTVKSYFSKCNIDAFEREGLLRQTVQIRLYSHICKSECKDRTDHLSG